MWFGSDEVVKHVGQEVKEYKGRFSSNALLFVGKLSGVKMNEGLSETLPILGEVQDSKKGLGLLAECTI
jgi:hypothetical protein